MYKQIIIARKDLHISPGKLAAQVSHASMAFLIALIQENIKKSELNQYMSYAHPNAAEELPCGYMMEDLRKLAKEAEGPYFYADADGAPYNFVLAPRRYRYTASLAFEPELYEQWLNNSYTKCVLQAKNRNQLMKATTIANEIGLREGRDFFLIRDNCHTELSPEDEDGTTLTCIGFKPMESEIIDAVGKKFHLWEE